MCIFLIIIKKERNHGIKSTNIFRENKAQKNIYRKWRRVV